MSLVDAAVVAAADDVGAIVGIDATWPAICVQARILNRRCVKCIPMKVKTNFATITNFIFVVRLTMDDMYDTIIIVGPTV